MKLCVQLRPIQEGGKSYVALLPSAFMLSLSFYIRPSYGGLDGASKAICQNALGCHSENDGWDAPDGYFGVSVNSLPIVAAKEDLD